MFNLFDLKVIPMFLGKFKVKNIVVIGLSNEIIINEILSFSIENDLLLYVIGGDKYIKEIYSKNYDSNKIFLDENVCFLKESAFNSLPNLKDIGAIFIDDDPNWYTTYSELNLIKSYSHFPLVFICNNKYPHNRRDSYYDPNNIPSEYKNDYCNYLPVEYFENGEVKYAKIEDGLYHAINSNTPKNGVLTAIEDFLNENGSFKFLEINSLEGISLIYEDSTISYFRIKNIFDEKFDSNYNMHEISDKLIENNILLNHISKIEVLKDDFDKIEDFKSEIAVKNNKIKNYEDEIELHNNQINYKNSQINAAKSQISLKETQIQNIEAKLLNKNKEFELKEKELKNTKEKYDGLEINFSNNQKKLVAVEKELSEINNKTKTHEMIENKYKELIKINRNEVEKNILELKNQNDEINQLKFEIGEKKLDLENSLNQLRLSEESVKDKDNVISGLKSELSRKELELENNLNHLKISEEDAKNKINVLKSEYIKQSNKLNSKEYCISCYLNKIEDNNLEINYLKHSNTFSKKILGPFAYIYIIFKSKFGEIMTNIKLYNVIRNSDCFDIGYYLNKYPDIPKSKWCKYFSPELHYVCNGFDENRKMNKKFFINTSKHELINYIKDR